MEKIKVAVLFGGQSTEHAVSLQSACAVLHAMKGTRFEAVPVGITREGRWFWYRGPLDAVGEGVWEKEECAPVTLTPDASVHGLLVQGAGSLYSRIFETGYRFHHMRSGASMPISQSPVRMVSRTARVRRTRASRTPASSSRMRFS